MDGYFIQFRETSFSLNRSLDITPDLHLVDLAVVQDCAHTCLTLRWNCSHGNWSGNISSDIKKNCCHWKEIESRNCVITLASSYSFPYVKVNSLKWSPPGPRGPSRRARAPYPTSCGRSRRGPALAPPPAARRRASPTTSPRPRGEATRWVWPKAGAAPTPLVSSTLRPCSVHGLAHLVQ